MAVSKTVVKEAWARQFGEDPVRIYRAPGRVNLIGEHTDYNQGLVLPIALDLACLVAAAPATDGMLSVWSENFGELLQWPIESLNQLKPSRHWSDYVLGVALQLQALKIEVQPVRLAIYSDVPVGAGLSSSAAIEVATALALLGDRPLEGREIAFLAQRAEREFAGVPCGIMDQYVAVFGEDGKAIEIDCRSVTHRAIGLPEGVTLIAVNSMVKHALGEGAYAERVSECQQAASALGVSSLREMTESELDRSTAFLPEAIARRARHVVTENERVEKFTRSAAANDLLGMGRLFLASHRSLQRDYEVSCAELDFLVDRASAVSGVYGARMTGGGFGGCTINLVAPERAEAFAQSMVAAYERHFGLKPEIYRCVPSAGAGALA